MTQHLSFSLELPPEPDSIPAARRAVERVAPSIDERTLMNLRLLVSEVVTNAVRHVPAEPSRAIELAVERTDRGVRVEVADHGPGFRPAPRYEASDRASGWGLNIVARVASRWGVENDGGARVWFELDVPLPVRQRAPV